MAYAYANDPSNADAIPLYNDNILKFWNWFDMVWTCADWMQWHKSVAAKYGNAQANTTFLKYWNDLATGSSAIDCRSFDTTFRNYMSQVGLLDELYSGVGIIAKPLGAATDVVTGISKGASGAAKAFRILIPLIIVAVIIMGIVYVAKKTEIKK